MASKKAAKQARANEIRQLREIERKKDRRIKIVTYGAVSLIVVALVSVVGFVIAEQAREQAALREAIEGDIDGVVLTVGDVSANHIVGVDYGDIDAPPAGGDHEPAWLNCGVYRDPVPTGNAVHSLEHGAVWISYDPEFTNDQSETLEAHASGEDYVIVSPFEDQRSPVVLSAWGVQLDVDSVDDERIDVFLAKYVEGPQTPERGATCDGGVGTPVS